MAGPILQNFKMIPCSKCSPVGLKLNAHLCENLNSSLLVCEMMLSHYHQGHGCHLWAFQSVPKTAGKGRKHDGFPSSAAPCDGQGLGCFVLSVCSSVLQTPLLSLQCLSHSFSISEFFVSARDSGRWQLNSFGGPGNSYNVELFKTIKCFVLVTVFACLTQTLCSFVNRLDSHFF